MYKCDLCATVTAAREPCRFLTLSIRSKTYPPRFRPDLPPGHPHRKIPFDPGGSGYETVRRIKVCRACHKASGG